jgi:hypothetical protein
MAAIFERQTVVHKLSFGENTRGPTLSDDTVMTTITHPIRQEPFQFDIGTRRRPFYLSNDLLRTSETDWLYNALDEITLNATSPGWTKDEWVFTPVNMILWGSSYFATRARARAMFVSPNEAEYIRSSVNVSIITSAVRSRLECSTVKLPTTRWLDSVQDVFPNHINESITGHVLPPMLSDDASFRAPVFTVPRRMACCTNGTSPGGQSIVAYWSSDNAIYDKPEPLIGDDVPVEKLSIWSKQFAIKWIVGPTASTTILVTSPTLITNEFVEGNGTTLSFEEQPQIGEANEPLLYFLEEPQITVLDCNPVIEQVNASVTLARFTNQILEYELLGTPQPALGAWDYPYDIIYRTKSNYDTCEDRIESQLHEGKNL